MRGPENAPKPPILSLHEVKIASELEKSINPDPNLISYEGDHGTSAYQMLVHSFHTSSRKVRTPNLYPFH